MMLKDLVDKLNKIEESIEDLEKQIKTLKMEKSKIWIEIMKHKTVREIYKTYMEDAKMDLYELLKINGYNRW